jgi:peptide deformylase
MAVRPILRYPDARLRQACAPVTTFGNELHALVEDMRDTMYLAEGAGLAAIQVGEPLRLFIIDPEVAGRGPDQPPLVLANPVLVEISEEQETSDEGCLSFPGIFVPVKRGLCAKARAWDVDGKSFEIEGTGLLARVLQHETDHLTGRLLIDMVGPVKRQIIKRKMRKENEAEAV